MFNSAWMEYESEQWKHLFEITRAIASRLELESGLKKALRYAVDLVGGEAGLVALRAAGDSFRFVARYGIEERLLPRLEPLLTEIPFTLAHEDNPDWRFPDFEFQMDDQALTVFADHVAIAIEHARLYQEVTLRAQELDAVIEGSAHGILMVGRRGQIRRVNRALEQLTG